MAISSWFTHQTWWFSIAMLVYQRVMSSINQPTNGKSTSMVKDYNRGLLISFPRIRDMTSCRTTQILPNELPNNVNPDIGHPIGTPPFGNWLMNPGLTQECPWTMLVLLTQCAMRTSPTPPHKILRHGNPNWATQKYPKYDGRILGATKTSGRRLRF
jgi:hypothetical protein